MGLWIRKRNNNKAGVIPGPAEGRNPESASWTVGKADSGSPLRVRNDGMETRSHQVFCTEIFGIAIALFFACSANCAAVLRAISR